MQEIVLASPFKELWADKNPFTEAFRLDGESFRQVKSRHTFRFEIGGKGYFAKLHHGCGWHEIFKDLFQFKRPILGADNEYRALLHLKKQNIDTMISHVELITSMTEEPYTWKGGTHMHCFGDWLGMDAPAGSYKGSTRDALICAAYYAYDVEILAKSLEALGRDASDYRKLYEKIREKFRKDFPEYLTQTEYVLALHFRLAEDMKKSASELAEMIHKNGDRLTTGFVGTPYLLHALSDNGYADLAYTLLLQEAYPSWLFSVNMGATTMWEHWDGINDKGEVWSKDMNSFNHYAYGSVADWVYEKAAGIQLDEKNPGFAAVTVAPIPDKRLGMLEASIDTRHGTVSSKWYYKDGKCRYEITVPVNARIIIDGKAREAEKGTYFF